MELNLVYVLSKHDLLSFYKVEITSCYTIHIIRDITSYTELGPPGLARKRKQIDPTDFKTVTITAIRLDRYHTHPSYSWCGHSLTEYPKKTTDMDYPTSTPIPGGKCNETDSKSELDVHIILNEKVSLLVSTDTADKKNNKVEIYHTAYENEETGLSATHRIEFDKDCIEFMFSENSHIGDMHRYTINLRKGKSVKKNDKKVKIVNSSNMNDNTLWVGNWNWPDFNEITPLIVDDDKEVKEVFNLYDEIIKQIVTPIRSMNKSLAFSELADNIHKILTAGPGKDIVQRIYDMSFKNVAEFTNFIEYFKYQCGRKDPTEDYIIKMKNYYAVYRDKQILKPRVVDVSYSGHWGSGGMTPYYYFTYFHDGKEACIHNYDLKILVAELKKKYQTEKFTSTLR